MITIKIDNRDTENIHIDTYHMLNGDDSEESTIQIERGILKDDTLTYDDFDWTYDHNQIVKDFADKSVEIIENYIDNSIIKSIKVISTGSPQFYNYTTDYYVMSIEVDETALNNYIAKNNKVITEKALQYDNHVTPENRHHAGLCHYIDDSVSNDDYNMDIWECETEIYCENTTYKLIKK